MHGRVGCSHTRFLLPEKWQETAAVSIFFVVQLMSLLLLAALALACYAATPPLAIPRGWGVNIHFTSGQPGELAMLSQGFSFTRMDFAWSSIETVPGVYDFSGECITLHVLYVML